MFERSKFEMNMIGLFILFCSYRIAVTRCGGPTILIVYQSAPIGTKKTPFNILNALII